ncbi:hypothetical protein pEaSNUABM34_00030 [Erwinia phage pEa_SNUABM_34]|nr:hypothetical protein pEaSNUABM34_00030 [Erwinia phage pEa_SNUABM_34]
MNKIEELRSRLAAALGFRVKSLNGADHYVDGDDVLGLVEQWLPDEPQHILAVIERYGLKVERMVKEGTRPRPGEEPVFVFCVRSKTLVYRSLSESNLARSSLPYVSGNTLTEAVLLWAVLRAERIVEYKADPLMSSAYNFDRLEELVYITRFGE